MIAIANAIVNLCRRKEGESMDSYEKARAILEHTHDGDDLTQLELWIVQEAVNNHLNKKGWEKFDEIYRETVLGQ